MSEQRKTKTQLIEEVNDLRRRIAQLEDPQQSEALLHESERSYQALLESPIEPICRFLPDTTLIFVNQKYCEIFGQSRAQLLGQSFLTVVPESDREEAREYIESLVQQPHTSMVEHAQPRPDGSLIWLRWVNHPITDAQGHAIEFLSIGHEITEHKQAEAAMHEQRMLAEALRDSAAALNSTLHLDEVLDRILANLANVAPHDATAIMLIESGIARIARSRGFDSHDPHATWVSQLRYSVSQVANLRYMVETRQALAIPDTHTFPGWVKRPETEWQRSYAGAPISIKGEVIGFVASISATVGFFNQTHAERLQTFADQAAIAIHNARLYEETDRLRAFNQDIVQSMDEGIVITDVEGRMTFVNPKAEALLEYAPGQLLNVHWHEIVDQQHLPEIEYQRAQRVKGIAGQYETELLTRLGKALPVIISAQPMQEAGQFQGVLAVFTDITRRKETEEELRWLTRAVEQSPTMVIITDMQQRIVYVNPRFVQLSGYSQHDALQMHVEELGQQPEDEREQMLAALEAGHEWRGEFYNRKRSGEWYWTLASISPIRNSDGKTTNFLSIQEDITQRKQADEDLRKAHNELERRVAERTRDLERRTIQLQVAAKVARDATAAHDLDELLDRSVNLVRDRFGYYYAGIFLVEERGADAVLHAATNPAGRQMLAQGFRVGSADASLVGEMVRSGQPQIAHIIDAQAAQRHNPLLPDTRSEMALPLQTHQGVIGALNVHSRQTSAFGEDDIAVLQTMADQLAIAIEKTRLFERVQATLEERLRTIVSNVPIILYAFDLQGIMTVAEGKGLRAAGFDVSDLVGHSLMEVFADSPRVQDLVHRSLAGESFSEIVKVNQLDWEAHFTPTHDAEGKLNGVIGVASDVTERMRAQEALRLAQKTESLGVMAGGVAHDFNNLLVGILGQTSLAQAKLATTHPARSNLDKAVHAAERAADLARQMLVYSGRGQFEIQPLDLGKVVQENLPLIRAAVPKNVSLLTQLHEGLPAVEANPSQMQQVIMNLIFNAAEAIGERQGTVSVSAGVQEVHHDEDYLWQYTGEPLTPGNYVSLTVRDTGIGMNAETLTRIFDPFFTTKFTGRGLGLASVLGIVRGHKAGLQVHSQLGRGTTFRLLFRASDKRITTLAEPDAMQPSRSGVILLIDDEEPVREAVVDILQTEDLKVLTAPDGMTGIKTFQQHADEIQMVMLDLSMPGLSGAETFHRLRAIKPNVPVILSSGYSAIEATRQFAGHELVGFIQKPYNARTLITEIRKYLEQVRRRR